MTPTPLSAAEIAEIQARTATDTIYSGWEGRPHQGRDTESDRRALLAHIAWQAERLAEAERERDDTLLEDQVSDLQRKYINQFNEIASVRAQLATEHAARLAAQGREAELRAALERYGKHDGQMPDRRPCLLLTDEDGQPQSDHCTCGLDAALASTDDSAGAVLAAADEWFDARQDVNGYEGHNREEADSLMDNYVACQEDLEAKVATWRARREGKDGAE